MLETPTRGARFIVKEISETGVILLLGEQEAHTPFTWVCIEGIADYLRGRGWVRIGSKYDVDADPDTLDAYLKGCTKRATAGWVAAVLEAAGVIDINRSRPAAVRLNRGFDT
jgi:hypothetical protein